MVLGSTKVHPVAEETAVQAMGEDESALDELGTLRSPTLGPDSRPAVASESKGSRAGFLAGYQDSAMAGSQHSAFASFRFNAGSGSNSHEGTLAPSTSGQDIISRVKSATQLRKASAVNMGSRIGDATMRNGALASCFKAPHPLAGRGLCFSPDGALLMRFGHSSEIRILNSNDGKVARILKGSAGHVRFASFSQDGRHIIAASDDCHVYIYNVEKVRKGVTSPETDIDVGGEPVAFCLLSPDGQTVLSCDDEGQLETWSVENEEMIHRYEPGHLSALVSFSSDGRHIISCANFECDLVVVNVATKEITARETFDQLQEGRNKPAYAISPDGSKAIIFIKEQTSGENVAVYDVESASYAVLRACDGAVMHVDFSSSGAEFLAAGRDNMIHVYDSETLEMIGILCSHTADVLYCRVSGDQQHAISGDSDGNVYTWNIDTCEPLLQLQAHKAPVVACDVSRDGRRAFTLDSEGTAHLWYLDQQGIFDILQQYSNILSCCELTPDGKHCGVGYSDGSLRLFTINVESSMVWQHTAHTSPVECLAFNPAGGSVVSGSRDGMLLVTSFSAGTVNVSVQAHSDTITWLSYNSHGSKLLSSSRDGTLCLWEGSPTTWPTSGPSRTFAFKGSGINSVTQCALDPRGSIAAACCLSGYVNLWDTNTGYLTHSIRVSDVEAAAISFSDDGRYVLVGSADGSSQIIEADSGKQIRSIVGNASSIVSVYFEGFDHADKHIAELRAVSVCSRQAVTLNLAGSSSVDQVADFLSDPKQVFRNTQMEDRELVAANNGMLLYDPYIRAAIYDMRKYDAHPGNSAMFRDGTAVVWGGVHGGRAILYSPPDMTVSMLSNETGGVKSLDFSPDGKLVVSGNIRGELSVWDMVHRQCIRTWMGHKRSSITCVKFSQDSKQVYSCGEDTKVILWDWRSGTPISTLAGHQSPVVSVEMSLNGTRMVSGDKDGIVIIWDTAKLDARHVVAAHDGPILCCSICPDGSKVISSGKDEHICIIDCETGQELYNLDDSLDGKGLTVKFSFDGTRVQIGGDKGKILIWDMEKNCLLYDIDAHSGSVYDCSWSGDSRRLLSVGTDGMARLWDAAAGSELCQANFERGFGVVDSGGFVKCDLSAGGTTMAGCTAKGHLIQWDIGLELRKSPNGQMLYKCLASMPVSKAKEIYLQLLETTPLLFNAQDSRGWTVLMHAAANSNPEIIKLITGSIQARRGCLGLMASPLQQLAGFSSLGLDSEGSAKHMIDDAVLAAASESHKTPNAINIAIMANNGDCVNHLLNAVLDVKVTPGSYRAVTDALPEVAQQYPTMCEAFLSGLPLKVLGEMEIPSAVAAQGVVVKAATSYTSYKELWQTTLNLDEVAKGPMVVMEAVMVQLPFCASIGNGSILDTLVESNVPVKTFGSETVNAIITYKWRKFAQRQIYTKALLYMTFVLLFTAYAIVLSDDLGPPKTYLVRSPPASSSLPVGPGTNFTCTVDDGNVFSCRGIDGDALLNNFTKTVNMGVDFKGLASYSQGRLEIAMSLIIFLFGFYFMVLEAVQLAKLGAAAYFDSFWNFVDLASYAAAMVLAPCVLARYGMQDGGFVYALVALECVLLWTKAMFFGMAVDGLGTFIYMLIEILKGLKFFYVLLICLYISFGAAFMNLFRLPSDPNVTASDDAQNLFNHFGNFQRALLSSFLVTFGFEDARQALWTMWPEISIIMLCVYNFLLIVILLNMLITLMADLYKSIKAQQGVVFLRNRAELIMEVESTMSAIEMSKYQNPPPYLHLLRPLNLEDKRAGDGNVADSFGNGGMRARVVSEAGGPESSESKPQLHSSSDLDSRGLPRSPSKKDAEFKALTMRNSTRHEGGSRELGGVAKSRRDDSNLSHSRSTSRNEPETLATAKTRRLGRPNSQGRASMGGLSEAGLGDPVGRGSGPHHSSLERLLIDMSREMAMMRRTIEAMSQQQSRSRAGSRTDSEPAAPAVALGHARYTSGFATRPRHSPSPIEVPRNSGMGPTVARSTMPLPAVLPPSPPSDSTTPTSDKGRDVVVLPVANQATPAEFDMSQASLTQTLELLAAAESSDSHPWMPEHRTSAETGPAPAAPPVQAAGSPPRAPAAPIPAAAITSPLKAASDGGPGAAGTAALSAAEGGLPAPPPAVSSVDDVQS